MTAPQLHLPRTVVSDQTERAVDLLGHYFTSGKFIGSQWDGFDPSGTREGSANMFTSDDVASAALLNTPVPGRAVVHLLITQRVHFAGLLEAVGPDRDFIDVDPEPSGKDMAPVYELYEALKALPKIGPTIASKLVARKRPRLFPIIDSDLRRTVFCETRQDTHVGRQLLHAEFSAQDRTLWKRLASHHSAASLPTEVSVLRVFDVLAWMEAKAY
ncbi:DUF6308 family protein [Micrococcus sp. HG099]|uniref:DUF6308 family protein n=1 Tax=Micrococcus sp. HG099 TaxID=2969755 RepID=UPI00215A3535|nr:DUF6308 family protein [Micrococcus sp. HG099]MCR8674380.1 DUF6308 family protein [Micrococcus sp. HG099]